MKNRIISINILFFYLLIVFNVMVYSQTSNYTLNRSAITNCGCISSTDNYILTDATGQSSPGGIYSSNKFQLHSGLFNNSQFTAHINKKENPGIPQNFQLKQNYPNPFNPITTFEFSLPENTNISLSIYNLSGHLIQNLTKGYKSAGEYKIKWEAADFPSGVYLYKLKTDKFADVKKCILIK